MADRLTPKQQRFVEEYLIDLNATQAAIRAGYSKHTARSVGSENLTKPDIAAAIAEGQQEVAERVDVSQDYVLRNLIEIVERCMERAPVMVHKKHGPDNPFCPQVMHTEAARLKAADPDAYEHIWLGGYFLGGQGRVYSSFLNKPYPAGNVDEDVKDTGGDLLVGMDFNVNPMSADEIRKLCEESDERVAEFFRRLGALSAPP